MGFPHCSGAKKEFSRSNGLSKKKQLFTLHGIKQKLKEIFSILTSSGMYHSDSTLRFLFYSVSQKITQSNSALYQ